ncbi:hypothetical protein KNJ79_18285 [Sphingopyxis indica]|uniref:hypothetical protein n=1 Tax=Sphingopyxis indica TaxID=436663 RepID=UPI0029392029|nr:hypothetical protein [Sphingopyxis indica]WOF43055.1 hypothetical protein KNJ79_18285 [Sphingopyxis indica]
MTADSIITARCVPRQLDGGSAIKPIALARGENEDEIGAKTSAHFQIALEGVAV